MEFFLFINIDITRNGNTRIKSYHINCERYSKNS